MNRYAIAVVLSLSGVHAAQAADPATAQPDEAAPLAVERPDWTLQVTPYMWAAGLDGNISPFQRAPTIHIEKSFSDVMEDLNFGGFKRPDGR